MALTAAAQVAVAVGRTLYFVVAARLLGLSTVGDVTAVIATGTLLGLVTAAGTGPAATQHLAAARAVGNRAEAWRTYIWAARASLCALSLVAIAGGGLELALAHDAWAGSNLVIFVLAYGGYQFYRSVDYGLGAVASYTKTEAITNGVAVALTPLVLVNRWLLLAPMVVAYGLFIMIRRRAVRRALRLTAGGRSSGPAWRGRLGTYATINTLGTLASMASLQLGVVVARHSLGSTQAGLYGAAFALLIPILYLPRAVGTALLPRATAELVADERSAAHGLARLTLVSVAVALPAAVVCAALARPIIVVAAGARYADAAGALRYLFVASFFLIVGVPAVNTLAAAGVKGLRIPFVASVASVVVTGVWWLVSLTSGHGIEAIAAGVLAGSIVKSLAPLVVAFHRYKLRIRSVGASSIAVTAVAMAFGFARSPWLGVLVALTCVVCEYAAARAAVDVRRVCP